MISILRDYKEITASRAYLKKLGLSFKKPSLYNRIAAKDWIGLEPLGDINKSWDLHEALNIIRTTNLDYSSSVLDMGAYGSEMPKILNTFGFKDISVVDLNSRISLPNHGFGFCKDILIGDMYESATYGKKRFKLITSFSVLEHGYDQDKFVAIIDKILSKNGLLLISFDFSSEKLDTKDLNLFGLTWDIFTPQKVLKLEKRLKEIGVSLLNSYESKRLKYGNKVISHHGLDYTFAFMAFKRSFNN